jgi:hypothetical protein
MRILGDNGSDPVATRARQALGKGRHGEGSERSIGTPSRVRNKNPNSRRLSPGKSCQGKESGGATCAESLYNVEEET